MLNCTGPNAGQTDNFKSYFEARLGKPSHLLEGDKLRQFLENNKRVGGACVSGCVCFGLSCLFLLISLAKAA